MKTLLKLTVVVLISITLLTTTDVDMSDSAPNAPNAVTNG